MTHSSMWKDIIFSTETFFNLLLSRLCVVIFSVKQKEARLFVFTLPRDIQQSGALIKVDGHMCENGERRPRVAQWTPSITTGYTHAQNQPRKKLKKLTSYETKKYK